MLAELENISYYVQTPGHNKRFSGHNSGGIIFHSLLCPGNISYYVQLTGHNGNSMESFALHATLVSGPSVLSSSLAILIAVI